MSELRKPLPLYEKAIRWIKIYGDPLTIWIGNRPIVICSTKESFKDIAGPLRNILGGRMQSNLGDLQKRGFEDVLFSDFSPAWDVLRRVAHVAMRKYAKSEKLAQLTALRVDVETNDLFSTAKCTKDKNGNPVAIGGATEFIENIMTSVIAVSAFGAGFERDNPDFETLRKLALIFETEAPNGLPSDVMPILGWIFFRQENLVRKTIETFTSLTDRWFEAAKKSHQPGDTRHFTDALLNARDEFLADNRDSAKYLIDNNLRQAVFDIFGAGIGTTKTILTYCFLHLANEPNIQDELRDEIVQAIGHTAVCSSTDRRALPKTTAFIQEVIRYHPAAPLALPRTALADVTINNRFIPKGTNVLINLYANNRDPDIWGQDATEFRPNRFLTASKEQLSLGLTSFGIGARSCPGEKMAQADILYVVVRTLQNVRLSCIDGPGTADMESINSDILLDAKRQNMVFTRVPV
ncbi:steroid 17-alpha-hydroxylase/17 [Tropilaelaps mercedesae]|uniref:Steroid 17-alpha-hydroxylase/17 n=1 Tax=Tropilaelaps mercedesae TaxID=418985 RepID=A0A1V9XRA2_9ACAR|nr:steroid 17-alpha-hydroxylase/17 [Tropilaelaps mercedesae]